MSIVRNGDIFSYDGRSISKYELFRASMIVSMQFGGITIDDINNSRLDEKDKGNLITAYNRWNKKK